MKTNKPAFYILAITIIPMLISLALFLNNTHFNTMNKGSLISPAIVIQSKDLNRQWHIAFKPLFCCDKSCQETLYKLHQLHLILGNNYKRVRLDLIAEQACHVPLQQYFSRVNIQEKLITLKAGTIYLIDPEGNAFMYYPADVDRMAILKDLKRVLEVSQIG
jgi:hypothetical protein